MALIFGEKLPVNGCYNYFVEIYSVLAIPSAKQKLGSEILHTYKYVSICILNWEQSVATWSIGSMTDNVTTWSQPSFHNKISCDCYCLQMSVGLNLVDCWIFCCTHNQTDWKLNNWWDTVRSLLLQSESIPSRWIFSYWRPNGEGTCFYVAQIWHLLLDGKGCFSRKWKLKALRSLLLLGY